MFAVLLDMSKVRLSIPTPCTKAVLSTSATGLIPLKSNGNGGSKVTVVEVLLRILKYTLMERHVSGKPPKLCAQLGRTFGAIASGAPITKAVVLATVMVLLPFVAPEMTGTQLRSFLSRGGHVVSPTVKVGLLLGDNKILLPIPAPRSVRLLLLLPRWTAVPTRNLPSGM